MFLRTSLFSFAFSILLFIFIIELIRRRKLQERYSLLWLGVAVAMMIVSLSRRLLEILAKAVGIYYPPAALLLVGLLFVIALLLHYATVISKLSDENKTLAQKLAILENKLDERS
ncbi:MAG TPA: DUF2304 domain-containing protein [Actinobacteria bacterium]|nr:DUF2304 domain-containing protein [Actinomycetes bacterium]HEX21553.1 DUF2304 domain-containing protein [Actinomycetota bacterium]